MVRGGEPAGQGGGEGAVGGTLVELESVVAEVELAEQLDRHRSELGGATGRNHILAGHGIVTRIAHSVVNSRSSFE